jgi:PAS domain S-box-containing protein
MDLSGLPTGAGAWAASLAAVVFASLAAALVGLRDRLRIEQHAMALEAELERLQDQSFLVAESEERYRGLVEAQLDIIVQRDSEGRITFANEGFARLMGQPRDGLIGTHAALGVVESGVPQRRADGACLVDEAIRTPEGVRWLSWVETTIPGRDGSPELVRAGRDVTERVEAERTLQEARARAEAASEAKSRFLATVSHEFRTPLNGVLGMTDLLLDTPLTPEQTTYVRAVRTSGEALLSLIDEILDFSKIEAGRLDLAAEPFDLHALVEGVVELLAPKAQGKGIEIAAFVAGSVPRRVVGDVDRLRQVLVNLAGNAVKFTEAGGVGVRVTADAEGDVVIAVEDTGPGLAMDRVPALFEEFEQGDATPSRRHGGTGLGLAITRRIVERMRGAIEVDSTVGEGTTFRVRLPLVCNQGEQAPTPGAGLAGKRTVILARSPFEAPFLAQRLKEAGAEVALTATPDEALAKLAIAPCDLLIVDCAYGDDAVRAVAAEARLAGAERSLVLLSPFERRDFGPPSAAGFDGYLVKPVRTRSLFKQLTQPCAKTEPPDAATAPGLASAKPRRHAAGSRVLLAEDNEINALLALKSLEKLGAVADWAKDGSEALTLAEASFSGVRPPYDLVLMDIRMPGLDGLEATRRIRALERALGRPEPCRIVALTANALKEDETVARGAGLDGFLAKPLKFEALSALLAVGQPPLSRAS